jgi:hypothetical protein
MTADTEKILLEAELKAEAQGLKVQGNEAFKQEAWLQAVNCYTKVILSDKLSI